MKLLDFVVPAERLAGITNREIDIQVTNRTGRDITIQVIYDSRRKRR